MLLARHIALRKNYCTYQASRALARAKATREAHDKLDAVLSAEAWIARLRAYDAAGYFRGDNFKNLVGMEDKLRTLKALPVVRTALEL